MKKGVGCHTLLLFSCSISRVRFLYLRLHTQTMMKNTCSATSPLSPGPPLFITTTCVIVWKGGGVAPLFISWFFFSPWGCRGGKGKNLKMKICGERGGDFLNLSSWVPKGYPRGEGCPVTPPYLW
nr:hypothetical protein [Morchella crassipes]